MKTRSILILSIVVFILLSTSIAYAVTSENPFNVFKRNFIMLTEKLKDNNLSRDEKIAAYEERKRVLEQYNEEIGNSKSSSEELKKLELKKERDDILKDIVATHKITIEDYTVLEFDQLNDFFSGKIEGFEDKDFLEKAKPIINEFYFYKDVQKGNKRPFIIVKQDSSEILVIYKDYQGNNVVQKAEKANDTWEKSKETKQGKVFDGSAKTSMAGGRDNNEFPKRYASFDYEMNSLLLTDYSTNGLIKKIAFEKNSYVQNIHKFDKGYVIQVNYADTPVKKEKDAYGSFVIFPEVINRCILRVYDENLNLEKEIDVGSKLPADYWGPLPQSAVSKDGAKVAWAFDKLYVYEVYSGVIEKIFDEERDVGFSHVCFTRDSKNIVFTGGSIKTEEGDCVFGLIDLENRKMSLHIEKQYHSNSIQVTARYACIRDNGKPFIGTSVGRVPILDLQTTEAFTIKVGGSESAHARVSEDGKYLITLQEIASGNYRIRQYGLLTGEMLNERSITPDVGVLWNADIIYNDKTSTYELAGITEDGKYTGYSFILEDKGLVCITT